MHVRALFGVVAAIAVALLVGSAQGAADLHSKEFVQGAIATFSDCPFDGATQPICHDYRVYYARIDAAVDGGPTNRGKEPFTTVLEIFTIDVAADELISYEFGETADVDGTYDKTHLRFAQMGAPTPMPLYELDLASGEVAATGRTATLDPMNWTGTGERIVSGNDGPLLEELGLARHFGGRCETLNFHAHQKLRAAGVTPLGLRIDGTAVAAPFQSDPPGYVINHWFHAVRVSKNCAEP
jgi:hypothetical protein